MFLEKQLPVDVAPNAIGGPGYMTTILSLRGGGEYRNALWEHPIREYTFSYNARTPERIEDELLAFVMETMGALYGFRVKDWSDYKAIDSQAGIGDGTTYYFRMTKKYGNVSRRIMKPIPSTVTVKIGGVESDPRYWYIDSVNGVIVFQDPPASNKIITWSGEFDVPARFEDDALQVVMAYHRSGSISSIGIREIRVREIIDETKYGIVREFMSNQHKADLARALDALHVHVNQNWLVAQ